MAIILENASTFWDALRVQSRVVFALMLRDIRTRFFGTPVGYVIAILWPFANIMILLSINGFASRAAPYGDSAALWFATGLVPFTAFNYMARNTMIGLVMVKPLVGYPIIKPMDLLLARGILEILSAGCVVLLMISFFAVEDIPFMPSDPTQALAAIGASMLLGFGFGLINGVIAGLFLFWVTGYGLFSIIMWVASGVYFVPDALPESARYWLSFNPALQGVVWVRSAYFEGYGVLTLDKAYMLKFAIVSVCLGFLFERLMRGRIFLS
jgi:capsular polysaccharide transport system permease protein